MVSDNNILEFRLKSHWETTGDQFLNVFHYLIDVSGGTPTLSGSGQNIIDDWAGDYTSLLQDIISAEITFDGIDLVNLTDPTEIFVGDFTSPFSGGVTGDVLPPYAAWAFIKRRATASTRNGQLRLPGVPESLQVNGLATAPAVEDLEAFADLFQVGFSAAATLPEPFTAQFFLRIVRKDVTGALDVVNTITGVEYRSLSTQNTRKFGRGM